MTAISDTDSPRPEPTVEQLLNPISPSLQQLRPRSLKQGDTFGVFDDNGDIHAGPDSPAGLYHRDTRYLSQFSLTLDDIRPVLLSSTLRDDNVTLTCDLTNPDLFAATGEIAVPHDLIHIRRSRFLWHGGCYERLAVSNYHEKAVELQLIIGFAADFADLFEVRGARRPQHGQHHAPDLTADGVNFLYMGLDRRQRRTNLRFHPAPSTVTASQASFNLMIEPRQTTVLFIEIRCDPQGAANLVQRNFFVALRDSRRAMRALLAQAAALHTSNHIFNQMARRSIADLYMLVSETPEGPFPYAGIPWFSTVFGRDAIITALAGLWLDPALARGVLGHLAAHQAATFDAAADAEPGKILHEVRYGEMAETGEVPFRHYYGSIDSTPLFVMLTGAYLDRTGDTDFLSHIWSNIEAALDWIEKSGDRDGDGFVEYGRWNDEGLINQGWKDSVDSVFHEDGTLAEGPIALVEVQAYVYGAWCAAARIARALGYTRSAAEFDDKAAKLQQHFDDAFFDEELGTYVLALDGQKRPCRVRTSNAGHALYTGVALKKRATTVMETLMNRASFSGWGVRTVASTEARYNPLSYHNGSVWPHDNALIAAGFARYGYRDEAARIFEGLFAVSTYIDLRRLPELFCGFTRQRGNGPTFYPVACSPQAWAATAPLSLLQSCLGLGFEPARQELTFEQPALPDFLADVALYRLASGSRLIDVRVKRGTEGVVITRPA